MSGAEMTEITAGMVRDLRDKTDAPMMECKKALTEANGDAARAEEILRIKLGNKASKASARVTAEGVVATFVSPDGKTGAIIEINCETDFVAKNDDFLGFAKQAAEIVATRNPADVAALSAVQLGGSTVEEVRKALVGKIGENVALRRFARIAATGQLATYIHSGAKVGVLIDVEGGDATLAKDLAMHIAALKPVALSRDQIPAELIKRERDIAQAKAADSGKPANIIEKMVEGSVQKFLKEVTLLGQSFVKDDKQTVAQLLKGKGAKVHAYCLYSVGEGLEKRKDDFVAEVMAQAKQASKALQPG
jgi:elongation factor Ts